MYMYMHTGADHTLKIGVGVELGPIQRVYNGMTYTYNYSESIIMGEYNGHIQ